MILLSNSSSRRHGTAVAAVHARDRPKSKAQASSAPLPWTANRPPVGMRPSYLLDVGVEHHTLGLCSHLITWRKFSPGRWVGSRSRTGCCRGEHSHPQVRRRGRHDHATVSARVGRDPARGSYLRVRRSLTMCRSACARVRPESPARTTGAAPTGVSGELARSRRTKSLG